jgi:hypothetical protein
LNIEFLNTRIGYAHLFDLAEVGGGGRPQEPVALELVQLRGGRRWGVPGGPDQSKGCRSSRDENNGEFLNMNISLKHKSGRRFLHYFYTKKYCKKIKTRNNF